MVSYKKLGVGDPLSFVFKKVGVDWLAGVVAVSAVFAMTSVLLVFQIGQPRIWLTMSRDGLLPPVFAKVHPRFHTPSFSTIVTGFFVGVPALLLNMDLVIDLTSIGTLFAFALVCGGILVIDPYGQSDARFKVPYINGRFLVPLVLLVGAALLATYNRVAINEFWSAVASGSYEEFRHEIPMLVFLVFCVGLAVVSFTKRLSLLPVLGLLIYLYLMTQLGISNCVLFFGWLIIGLAIYFGYSNKHSKLNAVAVR